MVDILNFQITPYSDEVAAYINSLTAEQTYRIFATEVSADILTAALHAVTNLESEARKIMRHGYDYASSWIINYSMSICPRLIYDPTILDALKDIHTRDDYLFSRNIDDLDVYPNVFLLIIDGIYSGHIYAWTINDPTKNYSVTNIIGIRSSVHQIMLNKCNLKQQGIATIFLSAIHTWSASTANSTHYLRVLQPIGPMPKFLQSCGFVLSKTLYNQENTRWLFDNGSLGHTLLVKGLFFRDHDYIMNIVDPLKCRYPPYLYKQI